MPHLEVLHVHVIRSEGSSAADAEVLAKLDRLEAGMSKIGDEVALARAEVAELKALTVQDEADDEAALAAAKALIEEKEKRISELDAKAKELEANATTAEDIAAVQQLRLEAAEIKKTLVPPGSNPPVPPPSDEPAPEPPPVEEVPPASE